MPKNPPIPKANPMGRPLGSKVGKIKPLKGWEVELDPTLPRSKSVVIGRKETSPEERDIRLKGIDHLMSDANVRRHQENLSFHKKLMSSDPVAAKEFAESLKDPFEGLTERQRRLVRLRFRGMSWETAGKMVGISDHTVWQEANAIKAHYEKCGMSVDQNLLVGESLSVFDEVSAQAWQLAMNNEASPGEKIKALQLVLSAKEKQNKLLLDIGVMQKATTKHEHVLSVSPWVEQLQKNDRTQITRNLLESQFSQLDEPLPLEDGDDEVAFARAMAEANNEVVDAEIDDED